MIEFLLPRAIGLLIIAVLVALAARRLRLPYTVGLVAVGMALASRRYAGPALTHDFVYDFILPPLLFEAAINIQWRELKRDLTPILTLAIFGTLIAAGVVAVGVRLVLGWPAASAVMFGILIAATDPVAVIAMFKDNGIGGRLRLLTESESLFNDGAAAVLFGLGIAWAAATGAPHPLQDAGFFLRMVGGGLLAGSLCAGAALMIAGRSADHLVESTITAVTAYGAFELAEYFNASGVLATIAAGLLVGNFGVMAGPDRGPLTSKGRDFILELWEFIAFIANSLVFLLIGMATARIPFARLGIGDMLAVIALVLLSRALSVYPLCLIFRRTATPVTLAEQHVLWWGGLRGALGLALALSLPDTLPFRNEILIATFGAVAFSVIAQGITMPLLLRRLRFM